MTNAVLTICAFGIPRSIDLQPTSSCSCRIIAQFFEGKEIRARVMLMLGDIPMTMQLRLQHA